MKKITLTYILVYLWLYCSLFAGYYNDISSITPKQIYEASYIAIATVATPEDFTPHQEITLNVHILNLLKGDIGENNIKLVVPKGEYDRNRLIIDLSAITNNQKYLLIFIKNNNNYLFALPGSYIILPDSYIPSSEDPVQMIRSLLSSDAINKYKNNFDALIRNSSLLHSFDTSRKDLIISTWNKMYDDHYLILKHNFGLDVSKDITSQVLASLDKIEPNSQFLPSESFYLFSNPDTASLKILLMAYYNNSDSYSKLKKLDSIYYAIIRGLSPSALKEVFNDIIKSGSDEALVAALSVLGHDVNQLPPISYINLYLNSTNQLVKYQAYQCIQHQNTNINQRRTFINDFKKNPVVYINQWTPVVQSLHNSNEHK